MFEVKTMNIVYGVGRIMTDKRFKAWNKRFKALILLGILLLNVGFAVAQSQKTTMTQVARAIGCLACRIMQIVLLIVSLITALVMIFAGLKWVGSGEDPDARGQAKQMITHAIIGFVLVVISAFIVSWVAEGLLDMPEFASPLQAIQGCSEACGGGALITLN